MSACWFSFGGRISIVSTDIRVCIVRLNSKKGQATCPSVLHFWHKTIENDENYGPLSGFT